MIKPYINHKLSSRYENRGFTAPFVIVGFLRKQEQLYKGKKIILKGSTKKSANIKTGEIIKLTHDPYLIEDITISEETMELSFLLRSKSSDNFLIPITSNLYTEDEYTKHIRKYGQKNWNLIVQGVIKEGFTEGMLILSWGSPDKINRASYGDQWVYGSKYVYIKNGKITSWN